MPRRPGSGLGKNAQGPTQPIAVEMRDDKSGLGAFEEKKAAETKLASETVKQLMITAQKRAKLEEDFHSKSKIDFNDRRVLGNLKTALSAMQQFIERETNSSNEKSSSEVPPSLLAAVKTLSARDVPVSTNFYLEHELTPAQRWNHLLEMIDYLRGKYFYCIYCGSSFLNSTELAEECPGALYEDHD